MSRSRSIKVFKRFFTKHLLFTNTLVSGTLMGLGDALQQNLAKWNSTGGRHEHHYDWSRTGRMLTVGLVCGAPLHGWYKMLDWLLPGKSRMVILKKVLVDQVIASPTLILGFFIGMNTLEGKQFKQCIEEIKEKFLVLYMVDCAFWPPVQTINFYFLPPQLRVVYVSCAVLVWDVFLAYYKHMDQEFDCTSKSKQHSTV